ncbi:MAG: outer membrane protein transport protein [Bacteroidota bacterium]
MTRLRQVAGGIALSMFLVSLAHAGGFQLNEHGARAMAQGGAFAARATDGSAIYFNPAGLGFQNTASVYLGVSAITPATAFYGPRQKNPGEKTTLVSMTFTPINFYVTYPVMDRLTAAIGVNNPYGLGTEWPRDWAGKFLTTKVDLKTFFITPTVAYRLTDYLSVGAGLSYATGSVLLERAVAVTSIQLPEPPRVSISMGAKGVGFTAGLLYKPLAELSIGVSYRSSVKVDAEGNASFNPNYPPLNLPNGAVATKITLPATGFFGVAYRPLPDLEIEADVQYIGWSSYDVLAIDFKANNSTTSSPKNYQNTYILRFGGEYTLDMLHLRAGYLFDRSPVKTEYVEPLLPDANRNGYNVGLGYDITEHFSIDVAYLFLKFKQRDAVNTIPETSFDGTYTTYVDLWGVNFGYRF